MPNWCANLLEIAGPVEAKKRLIDLVKGNPNDRTDLSLQTIIPYTQGVWDYDWCVEHWGTKWDIQATLFVGTEEFDENDPEQLTEDTNLVYKFDSAWAPPVGAIKALAEMFPELEFNHLYAEPGVGFDGCDNYNPRIDGEFNYFPATNGGNTSDIIAGYIWNYG